MKLENTDIRTCWERIKVGLEEVKRKTNPDWRVEDVYAKCVAGDWSLFAAEGVDGFLIICRHDGEFSLVRRLFVVCAYYQGADDPFIEYGPFLNDLAKQVGARDIEFRSSRVGYQKKGWQVGPTTYRKEVDYG